MRRLEVLSLVSWIVLRDNISLEISVPLLTFWIGPDDMPIAIRTKSFAKPGAQT